MRNTQKRREVQALAGTTVDVQSIAPPAARPKRKDDENECRYDYPKPLVICTQWLNGLFQIKRDHPRVNRHNKSLTVGLRHNSDVSFIPTIHKALAVCYYLTNYATKLFTPISLFILLTVQLVETMNQKSQQRTVSASAESDDTRIFLNKCANKWHTAREVSSVQVAAYLLGQPMWYSSVQSWTYIPTFALYWTVLRHWTAIHDCVGDQLEALEEPYVKIRKSGRSLATVDCYAHRGPVFRHLCLYQYARLVSISLVKTRDERDPTSLVPLSNMPDHSMEKYRQEIRPIGNSATPLFRGPLFDYDEQHSHHRYQFHSIIMLALFVPWEDFLPRSEQPAVIWEELRHNLPSIVQGFVENVSLLKKSNEDAKLDHAMWKAMGDEQCETMAANYPEPDVLGSSHRSEHALFTSFWKALESISRNKRLITPALNSFVANVLGDVSTDGMETVGDWTSQPHTRTQATSCVGNQVTGQITPQTVANLVIKQGKLESQMVKAIEGDGSCQTLSCLEEAEQLNAQTGFEGDEAMFDPIPAQVTFRPVEGASHLDVAYDVAREMTLNTLQWVALGKICHALDQYSAHLASQEWQNNTWKPLRMYLGGEGGVGKTHVLICLQTVLGRKQVTDKAVFTATSGRAAALINGNTWHSALGVQGDGRTRKPADGTVHPSPKANQLSARWRRRWLMVLDEVSMLSLSQLDQIDQELRQYRGSEEDFGGMPILVFGGDFKQFQPVGGKSLLLGGLLTTSTRSQKKQDLGNTRGHRLWLTFDEAVVLTEQVRATDPVLRRLLTRIREGIQNEDDLNLVNSRYDSNHVPDVAHGERVLIATNIDRWSLNLELVLLWAKERNKAVSIFLSDHTFTKDPSENDQQTVMTLGDSGSDRPSSGFFIYCDGLPVVVNKNTYTAMKVVNGAEFEAVGIIPDPWYPHLPLDYNTTLYYGPPLAVMLQNNDTIGKQIVPGLDNVLLLSPRKLDIPGKVRLSCKTSRKGLPLTPSLAITVHKAQGQSFEKVTLGLYSEQDGKPIKLEFTSLYVQLSRGKTLQGIHLLRPVRREDFIGNKMDPEMDAGMQRLEKMSCRTAQFFLDRFPWHH